MEEIRILGIAPFESIRAAMERVAREEFPEVRFEAYTGDLEEGVKIAQRLVNENESYDVMISRGGTAELLKQKLTMPVVEITFSVYDILRAIKMAENYNSLYAIVGFPSITGPYPVRPAALQHRHRHRSQRSRGALGAGTAEAGRL